VGKFRCVMGENRWGGTIWFEIQFRVRTDRTGNPDKIKRGGRIRLRQREEFSWDCEAKIMALLVIFLANGKRMAQKRGGKRGKNTTDKRWGVKQPGKEGQKITQLVWFKEVRRDPSPCK